MAHDPVSHHFFMSVVFHSGTTVIFLVTTSIFSLGTSFQKSTWPKPTALLLSPLLISPYSFPRNTNCCMSNIYNHRINDFLDGLSSQYMPGHECIQMCVWIVSQRNCLQGLLNLISCMTCARLKICHILHIDTLCKSVVPVIPLNFYIRQLRVKSRFHALLDSLTIKT